MKKIEIIIKEKELVEEAKKRLRKIGIISPKEKEVEYHIKEILKEKLEGFSEEIAQGTNIEIKILKPGIFIEEGIRRETIKNFIEAIETEKRKWIKESGSFKKEHFEGKSLQEKISTLISIPADRHILSRYFKLMENFVIDVVGLCNIDLRQEEFDSRLNKLKRESKELQLLNNIISDYSQLKPAYYQKIIELFNKKFLYYGDNQRINEIVKKIKEII